MKKFIVTLVIGMMIIVMGCSRRMAPTTQQTQPPSQKMQADKPMVWKQNLYPKLAVGDPIVFLNSVEIVLDGSFQNQTFFLQDGAIYRMDSILAVTKTVPALTPGILLSMKKASNGQIQEMNVSFSQNDLTYHFNFQLKSDGSFTLNGNAKLIYNGKEYKLLAVTKGGECLLLVNFFVKKEVQTINEQAEGQSVSGTKVIK